MSATKEHHHDRFDKLTDRNEAGQRGTKQHPIGWLNMPGYKPETWNPIVGCSKVSPGCDNCYALTMAKRIAGMERKSGRYDYRLVLMPDSENKQTDWNGHTILRGDHLYKPQLWESPRMVFACSMGDLFHESADFAYIDAVFSVMSDYDQHIYILLTKRPEKMLKFWQWKREQHGIDWQPKENVWIGVTAENQEQANKRIPILLQIPASKRFVSIEPMLGPIDLTAIRPSICKTLIQNVLSGFATNESKSFRDGLPVIDWVICGGETGPKARPMHPDWVRSLRDQCKTAGTPFFFKQWGNFYTHWTDMTTYKPAFKMYESYLQFTQKLWVHKGDVLVDMDGKYPKCGGDMQTAKYPVAIMQPTSAKCYGIDGELHQEWPTMK